MRRMRVFVVALVLAVGMALSFSAVSLAKVKNTDKCGFVCKCKKDIAKMKEKHKAGSKSCSKKKSGNGSQP